MRYFPTRAVYLFAALAIVAGVGAVPVLAQNPITAAREAYRKAQEDAKRQREEAQRQKEQGSKPAAPQTAASPAAPQPAATPAQSAPAQAPSSQPVLLGDLTKSDAPVALTLAAPKDMPDIIGIHLHMPLAEAAAVLRTQYPQGRGQSWPVGMPTVEKPVVTGVSVTGGVNLMEQAAFDVTLLPGPQVVWRVGRLTNQTHANRATVLSALREKYGKETFALSDSGWERAVPASNDNAIAEMYWLRDAQGRPAALPRNVKDLGDCSYASWDATPPSFLLWEVQGGLTAPVSAWSSSFCIGVYARIAGSEGNGPGGVPQIIESITVGIFDIPLAMRSAKATTVWWRAAEEKIRQQEIEKSKQVKPKL